MPRRLLFVYNADGGLLPGLKDLFHKILSPSTYPCSLCALTFGATAMRPEWKEFIKSLSVSVEFLHRDEFIRAYPQEKAPLPAVFTASETGPLLLFISAEELNRADFNELMAMVRRRLEAQP